MPLDRVSAHPVDTVLSNIAAAYRNKELIADEVLPRVVVGTQNFKYRKWDPKDGFTIPDAEVGRTGRVKQVEFGSKEEDASCRDYFLEEPIPNSDLENAPAGYDILGMATETATDLLLLGRERRTAGLVFDPESYAASNKAALASGEQFSNPSSDPIKKILTILDGCIMRPNVMVLGPSVWTALRTHQKIVKATHGNAGDAGVAGRQAVAELFELKKLLVGAAIYNTANEGQTMTNEPVWGNHIALIYQDEMAGGARGRITFGFTAQFGKFEVRQIPDPDLGGRGGIKVRVGESVREIIVANDLGYLIQNAAA